MYLESSDCVHIICIFTLCFIFVWDDCTVLVMIWTFAATNVLMPPTAVDIATLSDILRFILPLHRTIRDCQFGTFFQLCQITAVFNVLWNKSITFALRQFKSHCRHFHHLSLHHSSTLGSKLTYYTNPRHYNVYCSYIIHPDWLPVFRFLLFLDFLIYLLFSLIIDFISMR